MQKICCMMSWVLNILFASITASSIWMGVEKRKDKGSKCSHPAHLASTLIMDWTLLSEMDSTIESSIEQRWKREGIWWYGPLCWKKKGYLKCRNNHAKELWMSVNRIKCKLPESWHPKVLWFIS